MSSLILKKEEKFPIDRANKYSVYSFIKVLSSVQMPDRLSVQNDWVKH